MAGPALADAIAALVLGDLLKRRHAEVLYGPWFNLIGAPALPESDVAETVSAAKVAKVAKAPKSAAKQPAASKSKAGAKPTTKGGAKPAAKPTTTVKSTKK
jgi:hypothetical protein